MTKKATKKTEVRNPQYQITLSQEQARVLMEALELVARLDIGQISYLWEHFTEQAIKNENVTYDSAKVILDQLKSALFPGMHPNASTSISVWTVRARTAWDLLQVIRHRLTWDASPKGGMQMRFNKPMKVGDTNLAEIKKV